MKIRLRCRSNIFGIRSCLVFHLERILAEKKKISAVPKSSLRLLFFLCFAGETYMALARAYQGVHLLETEER